MTRKEFWAVVIISAAIFIAPPFGRLMSDVLYEPPQINVNILNPSYDYQINISEEGYMIYSNDVEIGWIEYGDLPALDSIFIRDNE